MKTRFAFAGFRHGHVFDLLAGAAASPEIEIVAACEEDEAARNALPEAIRARITHTSIEAMLAEVPSDVVVVGDYYGKRGSIAIAALKAGRHVIADKPLCTSLEELDEIERLSKEKGLAVGLQLDLRDNVNLLALRKVLAEGTIGEVVTVLVTAQHPLNLGVRPGWYFEEGKHGGTINDIGIHAFDILPWLTGHRLTEVLAARDWNAKATQYPHFKESAQLMAKLANGAGVLADFSYLAPTILGFKDPFYWQIACHGTNGVAVTGANANGVRVTTDTDETPREIPAEPKVSRRYLTDFLLTLQGRESEAALTTAQVLAASREALQAQAATQAHG